jgi:hypothetical protein
MTTDYSTSKYENAEAEEADAIVLDGFAEASIYDGDLVAFDLITMPSGRRVILRRDSDGFVWIEKSGEARGDPNVSAHWNMLAAEYADDDAVVLA